MKDLKALLEHHYNARNTDFELSLDKPDPLFALKKAMDEKCEFIDEIAVLCALLAYGNATQILKTLLKLDFRILGDREAILRCEFPYYRFQTSKDMKIIFLAMSEIIERGGIRRVFVDAYKGAESSVESNAESVAESSVICGINAMIDALDSAVIASQNLLQNLQNPLKISQNPLQNPHRISQNPPQNPLQNPHKISQNPHRISQNPPQNPLKTSQNPPILSKGLRFLIGRKVRNLRTSSPLKRWNLLLRWMVRKDNIDLGLWSGSVATKDLILPLDTHTFRLSQTLGLLGRKSYDLRSAIEITANLATFCESDPVKYDFALYRMGQEGIL